MGYRWVTDDGTQTPTNSMETLGEIQVRLLILKSRLDGVKIYS